MSTYRPGRCNIGPRQRRRRATVAAGATVVAVAYVAGYLAGLIPEVILPGVFVPLVVAFEWGIQAYDAFCVRFALLNRYDLRGSGAADEAGRVTDPAHARADRVHAAKITVASVALAAVTTALVVVVLG